MCDHCGCRSFGPVAELTAEHEEILRLGWDLAQRNRAGFPADAEAGAALLALLDVHVRKEETGLYPVLIEFEGMTTAGCDELEEEHRSLRSCLVAGSFDRRAFYALAAHIEEEEMELFPAAMFTFDDTEWDRVAAAHAAAGAGVAVETGAAAP